MSRDFFCERCSLQFGKKYVFDLHLSLVHGEKIEVKVESPISEENLQESQNGAKVVSHHVVKKQLKCDLCKSVFKTKKTLKMHMQSIHERKKPFKSKKIGFNSHLVSNHEGKGAFQCNICDAIFA